MKRPTEHNRLLVAAAVADALAVGLLTLKFISARGESAERTNYATEIGQQRGVTLSDGTIMLLNTGTEVEVAMTKSARNVYLNRDETFLNVTRDPQRVFTLHTGDACVKVLGTELDAQSPDGTKIAVASGMVKAGAQSKKDYPDGHAIRTANEAAGRDAT